MKCAHSFTKVVIKSGTVDHFCTDCGDLLYSEEMECEEPTGPSPFSEDHSADHGDDERRYQQGR